MLSQTKPLSKSLLALALSMLVFGGASAHAILKMDNKTVDTALIYGMQNKKMGISALLGPNWVEGENGTLLNIYSPFMMLASKAAKGDFANSPTKADLLAARKKYGKDIAFYTDDRNRVMVKFAISFYGDNPDFAKAYTAKIVGFGRGREFDIPTAKNALDLKADPVDGGKMYEAINSYYFLFKDLENLQDFQLVVESPSGPPLTFRLNNEKLY